MPLIQCDIREGRTREQKAALAEAITEAVLRTIDTRREYIYVLIREGPGFNHIQAGEHIPEFVPSAR